jgi:hypothetical protein
MISIPEPLVAWNLLACTGICALGMLLHAVEAQVVELVRVGVDVWVQLNALRREYDRGTSGEDKVVVKAEAVGFDEAPASH